MNILQVTPGSMRSVAAECDTWAAKLVTDLAPPDVSSAGAAISAAVAAIGAEVTGLDHVCAARMQARAAKITAAAVRYETHEGDAAACLRRLDEI